MKRDYQELINNYQGGDLDLSGCEIKNLELGSNFKYVRCRN